MKLTIYKFLSIVLAGALCVGGIFYLVERGSHTNTRQELNNKIAELEVTVQETETAYSRVALEAKNLRVTSKQLQDVIDGRDEEIVALNKIVLKWKDKYLKIKDAQESVVDDEGNEVVISADCAECFKNKRFRVDFDHEDDVLRVDGFTLTNPPYAEFSLKWIGSLTLEVVITRDDNGNWRAYVDGPDDSIIPTELVLTVDPTVFQKKWYQKIGLGADLGVGPGVQTTIRGFYDVTDNMFVGPLVTWSYDGTRFRTFYGVTVGWYFLR